MTIDVEPAAPPEDEVKQDTPAATEVPEVEPSETVFPAGGVLTTLANTLVICVMAALQGVGALGLALIAAGGALVSALSWAAWRRRSRDRGRPSSTAGTSAAVRRRGGERQQGSRAGGGLFSRGRRGAAAYRAARSAGQSRRQAAARKAALRDGAARGNKQPGPLRRWLQRRADRKAASTGGGGSKRGSKGNGRSGGDSAKSRGGGAGRLRRLLSKNRGGDKKKNDKNKPDKTHKGKKDKTDPGGDPAGSKTNDKQKPDAPPAGPDDAPPADIQPPAPSRPRPAPPARPTTNPRGGSTMSQFPLASAAAEFRAAANQYHPKDMFTYGEHLKQLPDVVTDLCEGLRAMTARAQGQLAVEPNVVIAIGDLYQAFQRCIQPAADIYPVLRNLHEKDFARQEAPRNGVDAERGWNVQ